MLIRIGNIKISFGKDDDANDMADKLLEAWTKIAKANGSDIQQSASLKIKAALINLPEQDLKWLYDNNDAIYAQYVKLGTLPSGLYQIRKQSEVLDEFFKTLLPIDSEN